MMSAKRQVSLALVLVLFVGLLTAAAMAQRGHLHKATSRLSRISSSEGYFHAHIGRSGGSRRWWHNGRPQSFRHRPRIGHRQRSHRRPHFGRRRLAAMRRSGPLRFWARIGSYRPRRFYYFGLPYRRYYYRYPSYYYSELYRRDDYDYLRDNMQVPRDDVQDEFEQQEPEKAVEEAKMNRHLDRIAAAFAAGDYRKAVRLANRLARSEPDNPLLGFVYSQGLFASGKYKRAAEVLRNALSNVDAQNREVFYPLGFYPDEDVLAGQIEQLSIAVGSESAAPQLQLLLGYQLLGLGRYDEALKALQNARHSYVNKEAAELLIEVLEKSRQGDNADIFEKQQVTETGQGY